MLKVDKNPVFHLVRIGSGTDGASPAPSQDTGCGLELPILLLCAVLLLSGCGAREDGPLWFCNFNTTNAIIAAPINIPCCMFLALMTPDRMWGDPNRPQYLGGYSSASEGGGSGADFWGGIGSQHLGDTGPRCVWCHKEAWCDTEFWKRTGSSEYRAGRYDLNWDFRVKDQ